MRSSSLRFVAFVLSVLMLLPSVHVLAQTNGNMGTPVDSTYFTPWAALGPITPSFLDSAEYTVVYGYPSVFDIDVDRAKRSGLIKVDQRLQLFPERDILHCSGDSVIRRVISPAGVMELLAILNDTASYSEESLYCLFMPRHTFTFVNSQGELTGVVELCFECGQISVRPQHFARKGRGVLTLFAERALATLCEREGLFPPCVRLASAVYFDRRR